jgi:predicted ATPase/class 3 adenylate cyclase
MQTLVMNDPAMIAVPDDVLEAGIYAFLFTDIEGSTARWEASPADMRVALGRHDEMLRAQVAEAGGRIFKATGDGAFAVFASAGPALTAALRAQAAFAAADFRAVGGLKIRMAVHAGPASPRGDDFFGPALNRTARLLAAAHGGQILVSAAAASMAESLVEGGLPAGASLLDLGRYRLKDLGQAEAIFQLSGPGVAASFPPPIIADSYPHNLPRQATSFIGRDRDAAELAAMLAGNRLVTLVGPGGLGKTRLALRVGDEIIERFPDGEWLVELAPLTADTQVAEALASLLGLTLQGQNAADAVARYLKPKRLLIILDNCEHLVEGAASLAAALLKQAPDVVVLVTSREKLGVAGEQVFRMPALGFPEDGGKLTVDDAMAYTAVQLFVARAGLAVAGFALTAETAGPVAEICRRLDGMPLAIELAAARIRMLSPAALLGRLKDRFKLLTGGARTVERRQQTLRALIEWSFQLLSAAERILFRRLAVFGGSFTMERAALVAADGEIAAEDVFDLLAALLDKSMLIALAETGGETRYRLLESTRQYGLEALAAAGEAADVQRRMARTMLDFYAEGDARWAVTESAAWRDVYMPEVDNLRAALEWTLVERGDIGLGLDLVSRSYFLWSELALVMERHRWFDAAAALVGLETPADIEARIKICLAGWGYPQKPPRIAAGARALVLYRELGDEEGEARAAAMLANLHIDPEDMAAARRYRDVSAGILPRLAVSKTRAITLNHLAVIAAAEGDIALATNLTGEAYGIAKALGDQILLQNYGINLGEWLFLRGDYAGALARAEEVAESSRRNRDTLRRAYAVMNLIAYHLMLGNLEAARAAGREAIPLHIANADAYGIAVTAEDMALLAARAGNATAAARLAGFGDAYYRGHAMTRTGTELAVWEALTEALAVLGERDFLMAEGAAWSGRQAMEAALLV